MNGTRPPSEAALLDIIGDIYDCAIEPSRWPAALGRTASVLDGAHSVISLNNTSENRFTLQARWNGDEAFEQSLLENFCINPFHAAVWYADIGEPVSSFAFYDFAELEQSLWYQRTVGAHGYGDAAIALLARSVSQFGVISVHRLSHQPWFHRDELAVLGKLTPHIRRAALIADLLDARTLERDMLSATLELSGVGIILTDETARIVHANHAALRILDSAEALRLDGDRLSALDPKAAAELRQAIADAASGSTVDIPNSGIAVPVGDLAAWVLPLDAGLRGEFAADFSANAVVFMREIGDTQPLPAELFVRRYRITPAECRLLVLLTQGMTIAEAAETQGIALSTAKTHLARLFQKTDTQRQAELVRLTMSAFAPAAMSSGDRA